MASERLSTMRWFPCTCACAIDFGLWRDGVLWDGAFALPETIIEKCAAHAAATTAAQLEDLIAPENEALAQAYGHIVQDIRERFDENANGLVAWSINEARQVLVTVRGASPALKALIDAVPNLIPTYKNEGEDVLDVSQFPPTTSAATSWPTREAGSTQRIIQGAHKHFDNADVEETTFEAALAHYFNVVGNDVQAVRNPDYFNTSVNAYYSSRHIVDFGGTIDLFAVKIDGNKRTEASCLRYRVNDLDTDLWVFVPALRMGVFLNTDAAATFADGDDLVGFWSSPAPTPLGGPMEGVEDYVSMRANQCEILPTLGRRNIFRAGGSPGSAIRADVLKRFCPFPMGGAHFHYKSQNDHQLGSMADAIKPMQMKVRAAGTFSYLQAFLDPSDRQLLIGLQLNGEPVANWEDPPEGQPGPNFPFVAKTALQSSDWVHPINETDEAIVANGDLLNVIGIDQPVGVGDNTIWQHGMNWRGKAGNTLIDMVVQEDWQDSYGTIDGDPELARLNNFAYVITDMDGNEKREWFAGPIGLFHPRTRAQIAAMPLGWWDVEVRLSFAARIQNLRAYMDQNVSTFPIQLSVAQDSGAYGDLDVECLADSGWYEDPDSQDDVPAGVGWGLRFNARIQDNVSNAHISTICFSYKSDPGARECLVRILPAATAVAPLGNLVRLARSLKITRTDGQVFAYTEHDRDITYDVGDGGGEIVYKSCGGFEGSASELGSVLGEVGNMEIRGFAKPLGLSVDDLFGGMFDGAIAAVWLLPWGEGNTQPARRHGGGVFGPVKQGDRRFTLEALSWSEYFKRRSLLSSYTPTCRHKLGPIPEGAITGCNVDLACMGVTGTVTLVEGDPIVDGAAVRLTFFDSARTEASGWFAEGEITFLSGANAGQARTVKYSKSSTGEVTVWEPLTYPIEAGDGYSMTPGCDKTKATCIAKFNNLVNPVRGGFGGFDTIPGVDATSQTPSGRSGE